MGSLGLYTGPHTEHGLGMRIPNAQPTSNEERGEAAKKKARYVSAEVTWFQ